MRQKGAFGVIFGHKQARKSKIGAISAGEKIAKSKAEAEELASEAVFEVRIKSNIIHKTK